MVDIGAIQPLPGIENAPENDPYPENSEHALLYFPGAGDIDTTWQPVPEDMSPFPGLDAAELECAEVFQLASSPGFEAAYLEKLNGDPVDTPAGPSPYTSPEMPDDVEVMDQPDSASTKRGAPIDNPASDNPQAKKQKRQRRKKDEPEPDYSAIIRDQVKNTTRTGQACDRCKVSPPPSSCLPTS